MNSQVSLTLDEAVAEVHALLTGIDLQLVPERDRYQAITRQLNRALRAVALVHDWSYYSDLDMVGTVTPGTREVILSRNVRPRVVGDDAIKLVDPRSKSVVSLVYYLPRDAAEKYDHREGLRATVTRNVLKFTRAFHEHERGLEIHIPVMREPKLFQLPQQPEDLSQGLVTVPSSTRDQLVDFDYPDLVIMKAAYFYAQTEPVLQARVMQLNEDFDELKYALVERDTNHTDSPYQNEWNLGIQGSINSTPGHPYGRGIADERGFGGFRI